MKKTLFAILCFFSVGFVLNAQKVLVKNNLLYDATTTPNLGLEFRLSPKTSLSFHTGYNPFEFSNNNQDDGYNLNPKLKHWSVMPEFKYWLCKTFERNYIGVHGIYSEYNVGGISQIHYLENYRYDGIAYGGGLSYGHQWALGGRWGLEASLGAGYLHLEYDKYNCGACGESLGTYTRNYWGLTKASLAIIFFIQ